MTAFINLFNDFRNTESILGKAAIIHLYFESIHPFEDGNGRIGRALVEKFLSKNIKKPLLIAISQEIMRQKKQYYSALAICNKILNASKWVEFFAKIIVASQKAALDQINFLMAKSKLMNNLLGKINARQEKALLRIFSEGINGFSRGLSAENYIAITKTSKATATRDLTNLVQKEALYKTGELRHTRYYLNIEL